MRNRLISTVGLIIVAVAFSWLYDVLEPHRAVLILGAIIGARRR